MMGTTSIPTFTLRFPLNEVRRWAAAYSYADDAGVESIGAKAGERGHYTKQEFLAVTKWKTERSKSRCAANTAAAVRDATELALATTDERLRIGVVTLLQGVEMPTASVLLHLAQRDPYPILDYRALWSLGVEEPPVYYSFDFWWAYVEACRSLAKQTGVEMRTLDRALWQYSKEHQG